jgi:hypothetical protein
MQFKNQFDIIASQISAVVIKDDNLLKKIF